MKQFTTMTEISKELKSKYNIDYSANDIGSLLKKLGLREDNKKGNPYQESVSQGYCTIEPSYFYIWDKDFVISTVISIKNKKPVKKALEKGTPMNDHFYFGANTYSNPQFVVDMKIYDKKQTPETPQTTTSEISESYKLPEGYTIPISNDPF